jgi:hypothetical protein
MKPLITVEDVFDIESWGGLVIVPGPLVADGPARPEGPVLLRRPDSSTTSAILRMGEVFQTPPPKERRWACLLKGIDKDEVPIGTEIWPLD